MKSQTRRIASKGKGKKNKTSECIQYFGDYMHIYWTVSLTIMFTGQSVDVNKIPAGGKLPY